MSYGIVDCFLRDSIKMSRYTRGSNDRIAILHKDAGDILKSHNRGRQLLQSSGDSGLIHLHGHQFPR